MIGKLLMLGIIVAIIYFFIAPRWTKKNNSKDKKKIDSFVECEKCGTYIDVKNSIISNGKYICEDCMNAK